ncbi:MAG: arsenate reductase ArsC [Spirochaetes bacterium]|nr:arsenate reductase ArsC [Spirochaetota bacterium]
MHILVICVHNSARSQMTEAYLRRESGGKIAVESAGLEPGSLNPFVVRALREDGIDIEGKPTQSVFDLYRAGKRYTHVITVCSKEAAERCPIFLGGHEKLFWPFPDPSGFTGTEEQVLEKVREVRDAIKEQVRSFLRETFPSG